MSTSRLARLASCLLLALAACDRAAPGGGGVRGAPASTPPVAGGAPAGSPGGDASCPETGLWATCSVEKRLEEAGLVPRRDGDEPARRDGFSVPGVKYLLGRSRLELFVYADAAAAAREFAALDTVRAAPPGDLGDWGGPPHLMRTANLLAVLVTLNERQAERVQLALTAGPPQRQAP
jgi:hypothetical protein